MKKAVVGALAISLAAAAWGFDGVVLTPRLFTLDVAFVVFLIHAVPFLLMQPFLFSSWKRVIALDREGWVALTLASLTGGMIGTLALVKALFLVNFHQLSVVILLQKLQPVFALLLAALLLKERPGKRFLGWAALAIIGAYILSFGFGLPDFSTSSVQATLLSIVAAIAFGSATVFGKRLVTKLDFTSATFGRFGITSLAMLLFLLFTGKGFPFGTVTPQNWLIILIIAVTTGSGAIFLYYFGLARIRASVSTICELALPLSAVLFDYLINGSRLHPSQWFGMLLLLGSIIMVMRLQAKPARA